MLQDLPAVPIDLFTRAAALAARRAAASGAAGAAVEAILARGVAQERAADRSRAGGRP
ncbi:MAG: hypothetical protein NDI82_12800 [Anaeromyxobacteraceae bacterium]|nr:hypothetical protein [Anaeromyxobacteraceae bacterium]